MAYDLVTYRGTPTFTTAGKFGNALASGTLKSTGTKPDLFLSSTGADGGGFATGTIECWVNASAQTATKILLGHLGWYYLKCDTSGNAGAEIGGTSANKKTITSTKVITDGTWHHVALVIQPTTATLYVDGAVAGTTTYTSSNTTTTDSSSGADLNFVVGDSGFSSATFQWPGAVDEVRLSDTARYTAAFTSPTVAFASDDNTVALYHLESGADSGRTVGATPAPPNVTPDDANLIYSPYNWVVSSTQAETVNSGAYVRAMFGGGVTQIVANFDTSSLATPTPYITYRVDNGTWTRVKIASTITLTLPSNGWDKHVVELVVAATTETQNRWTASRATAVKFTGFTTTPSSATTLPVTPRSLRVLVYGDSITEGVRTLSAATGDDVNRNDVLVDYSWALREALGAEVGIVGFGRQGWDRTGNGSVPALKDAYNLVFAGATRAFTPAPDLIVIAHGTNDTASVTATGLLVVNALLAATPAKTKIVLLRPFIGTAREAELQAVAVSCSTPSRVRYVSTDGWWTSADAGDGVHPYGYSHVTSIGPRTAVAARALLGRGATVILQADGSTKAITGRRL